MAENFKESWKIIREKGFVRFIFKEGIITGLIYGIIAVALLYAIDNYILKNTANGFDVNKAVIGFILVFVSNIAATLAIWFLNEKKFKK